MNDVAKIAASTASQSAQDPNYLPILLLMIGIIAGGWLFKWLVGRLEKQTTLLEGLFKEANEGRVKVAEVLAINSDRLAENTEIIRRCTEEFQRKGNNHR